MDELFDEIAASTGLDRAVARKAVGIIIAFVGREAPPDTVAGLFDKLPGARALADENTGANGGLFGLLNDLTGAGLGMAEIQSTAMAFVTFAKTKAGEKEVDAVIAAIPSLGQFM
jgi:hypothetical protein